MVRAGTSLIVEVTGTAGSWWNPANAFETENGIKADVRAGLLPYAYVDGIDIDDRGITDIVEWDYRATVRLRPKADYGNANDLASIVAHMFYEATGYLPSATVGQGSQPSLPGPPIDLPSIGAWATVLVVGIAVIAVVVLVKA
jgi:hypothetical protein